MTKTVFNVSELTGTDPYKLATGLIVPRPIGWIGTLGQTCIANLAPFSFFNVVSGNPPMFVFAPSTGIRRDTLDNVRSTREFTINIVSEDVAEAMNQTSASVEAEVDEFDLAGLTSVPGTLVAAPLVGECKANIECRVTDIIEIGDPEQGNSLVIGEGVVFHVEDSLLDGTRIDSKALKAVGRHVGNSYSRATDLFEIIRPA